MCYNDICRTVVDPTISTVYYLFALGCKSFILSNINIISHAICAHARPGRRRQMSCLFCQYSTLHFCNKMEAHGIRIVEIDGVSILTHNGNILNPFSERFTQRYLANIVGCSSVREDILSTINNHFDNHSKSHYVRKSVVSTDHASEIAGVKESKLNVCKLCFNHASKSLH